MEKDISRKWKQANKQKAGIAIFTTDNIGLKKPKINQQRKQKQTHRYREHFDSCQMGGRQGDGRKW